MAKRLVREDLGCDHRRSWGSSSPTGHAIFDDASAGLGVPIQSQALNGMDSLLSIAQMPAGIPVGTLAIGEAGQLM